MNANIQILTHYRYIQLYNKGYLFLHFSNTTKYIQATPVSDKRNTLTRLLLIKS